MEIYLDVLLLENFIVDMALLKLTSKLIKVKVSNKRLIVSSIIGSLYTLTLVFRSLNFLAIVPIQLIVSKLLIDIIMGKSNAKLKIKGTGIFLLSSIMLSGLCYGLSLWMYGDYNINSEYTLVNYSIKTVIISILILYLLSDRVISFLKDRISTTNFIYDVEVTVKGKSYLIKGFLDTGNSLREPVTNLPCIIVEDKVISLKEEEREYYLVPYTSVGHKGYLKGYKGNNTRIRQENNGRWKVLSDVIVCPCREDLSKSNGFNALLSIGIL